MKLQNPFRIKSKFNTQIHVNKIYQGTPYGGWTYCPDNLSSSSVIYSFGVGEDISFDQCVISKFGCNVFAFDPTPGAIRCMINQNVDKTKFHFYPYGISDFDGDLELFPPPNPKHVSYSIVQRKGCSESIKFPVKRLATIVEELGHKHIDILKMDIEASEYSVIPTIIEESRRGLIIDQLLIEFHHRFNGKTVQDTQKMIQMLNDAGYDIFSIRNDEEFSFKKVD